MRHLFAICLICWATYVSAQEGYPKFSHATNPPPLIDAEAIVDGAFFEVQRDIARQMGKSDAAQIGSGEELQSWMRENGSWLAKQAQVYRQPLEHREWPLAKPEGRMPLPSVIANRGGGLVSGIDGVWSIDSLADDAESVAAIVKYGFFFQTVFENAPSLAVSWRIAHGGDAFTTADIVEMQSALGYWPGGKLTAPLPKSDWQALHQSANPLNRFIALEKFDSVEQSPAELLALYRECLFGACSYLEVRALEAITRNEDFREEVAKLLEEYIASNPPANDGTLPGLRNNFPNLIEGAKRVIAAIRNTDQPAAPTSPQVDPFAQTTSTPKPLPLVQPPAPKKALEAKPASTQSEEPTSSTPWSVVAVLIVAATGLLWLLVRNRK